MDLAHGRRIHASDGTPAAGVRRDGGRGRVDGGYRGLARRLRRLDAVAQQAADPAAPDPRAGAEDLPTDRQRRERGREVPPAGERRHPGVLTPKSGKVRAVPLAPAVASALAPLSSRERWTGDDDDLVFVGATGSIPRDITDRQLSGGGGSPSSGTGSRRRIPCDDCSEASCPPAAVGARASDAGRRRPRSWASRTWRRQAGAAMRRRSGDCRRRSARTAWSTGSAAGSSSARSGRRGVRQRRPPSASSRA